MKHTKFLPGDKVLILDKNYGCSYDEVKSSIKGWRGRCGIGWILQVYNTFNTVGYTRDDFFGDFYKDEDLKIFLKEFELEEELFDI